jgi:hypothetical protein
MSFVKNSPHTYPCKLSIGLLMAATLVAPHSFATETGTTPDILDGSAYGRTTAEEQSTDTADDSSAAGKSEFAGIPALFSSPETGIGGGGAVVYLGPKIKARRDFALVGATLTERKQFLTAGLIELFDSSEYFSIETNFKLTRYPDFFFGIGNKTKLQDKDLYTMRTREISLLIKASPQANPKHQLGIGIHQDLTELDPFTENGILATGNYEGKTGGVSRDLTLTWQYQNNDEDFDPREGTRITWDLYRSTKILGSDFENLRFWSNNAVFMPISKKSTLALQLYGQFSQGEIPWYHLAQSGGTNLLRGYFMGRYRDRQLLATQAEVRRHLFRRIGVVAFGAVGQVAPKAADLFKDAPLVGWGAGLRFRLTKNQRINARLDVGFNRSEPTKPALYLYILEAF